MHCAIVHDWLVSSVGGGEKVLESIHQLFPSPIYTLVCSREKLRGSYFQDLEIISSLIQKLPRSIQSYKNYLPLFPFAIEQFDLSAYEIVLSSSHCVAKGAMTHAEQLHICYCHTPVRYAWDLMHEYLKQSNLESGIKGYLAKFILHYLRGWDTHSSNRVDYFIANSHYVAQRIQKYYQREAEVIYPPVDLSFFGEEKQKDDYYIAASRFVPYKRMGMIVEAFSQMPDRKLVVIGDGPEWKKVQEKAGKNIELLGYQTNASLRSYLQKAKGFIFAAVEDFGILPVEAMACGTPVIAYGKGAIRETVIDGKTGLFFSEQTAESLIEAVRKFESMQFCSQACRLRAEEFSKERFLVEFNRYVRDKYDLFLNR